jgi:hypothetical protein
MTSQRTSLPRTNLYQEQLTGKRVAFIYITSFRSDGPTEPAAFLVQPCATSKLRSMADVPSARFPCIIDESKFEVGFGFASHPEIAVQIFFRV